MTDYAGQQNAAFLENKSLFFNRIKEQHTVKTAESKDVINVDENVISAVEGLALTKSNDYKFLLTNFHSLEAEFSQMFVVLEKQRAQHNEIFWLYCYYNASLLEAFYDAYSQSAQKAHYTELKQQIKDQLFKEKKDKEQEDSFIQSLEQSFIKGLRNLINAPFHASKIRDYVGFSNLCRLYWIFCRLTLTNGLILAKELKILEQLDAILGTHTDVDKIISVIQAPNGILNYFSVGLFLARFIIDAGMLVKHTWFPNKTELSGDTTCYDRLKYELYKRQFNFGNDLVWSSVNFLTNFNYISNPVAAVITAIFLGFDVSMNFYKMYFARKEYIEKKSQYSFDISEHENRKKCLSSGDKEHQIHDAQIAMLIKQCDELDLQFQKKQATLYFGAGAAALLMTGFSATIILTSTGMVVASFFACTIAAAMYFSMNQYSQYKEASLRLKQKHDIAQKEYVAARDDFIFVMVKNTLAPTFLIATLAICWPAAIAFTALYIGCEMHHSYTQHNAKQEIKRIAVAEPREEDVLDVDEDRSCLPCF
ncbi:MAG: hypothetical protein QM652_13440 [Legionella sp.]|uniref:hypothetical protein n=1 Tax=Legionella sp. TaxID=459 RepID=UPI0039E4E02D